MINTNKKPVTFCADIGRFVQGTPMPFDLQQLQNGHWGTLLIGTDIGNSHILYSVAEKSEENFNFVVKWPGIYRLVLNYYAGGEIDGGCERLTSRKLNRKESKEFTVH